MVEVTYSLVQYVGDPVRREALNVGVAVVELGKRSIVRMDMRAHTRISSAWPGLEKNLYFAFIRDLRHVLAETHQLYLAESAIEAEGPAAGLATLSDRLANQFRLTEPRKYVAESARAAAEHLFRRMVTREKEVPSNRPRYMTRAELRTEISQVLGLWLAARLDHGGAMQPNAELEGSVARHRVDLATYSGETEPEMVFFAAPLAGQQASLIRDAIPTIVIDLKGRFPDSEFYAVLGEPGPGVELSESAQIARTLLGRVPGLTVLDLRELRETFKLPGLAPAN